MESSALREAKAVLRDRYWRCRVSRTDYPLVLAALYTLHTGGATGEHLDVCAQGDAAASAAVVTAWRRGAPAGSGVEQNSRVSPATAARLCAWTVVVAAALLAFVG